MGIRKTPLVNNEIYHIYSRSIAGYNIFKDKRDYDRFYNIMEYYRRDGLICKYSDFIDFKKEIQEELIEKYKERKKIIEIIAYCIMPSHFHLVLKQKINNGISNYLYRILKSYSMYFNSKYKRKGTLWDGRFKNILVNNDDQLVHLTRYIHLNPVSSKLVLKPEDWKYSSYNEYITQNKNICNKGEYFSMSEDVYKKFVQERKQYQIELEEIKHLLID